jgi:transformation/transcription domain-associated protein
MLHYEDLWNLRKRFTSQMACLTFMTYVLSIGQRTPQKFYISLEKGNVWTSEFFSTISPQTFLLTNSEAIPFRLTPNLQQFITPIGLEGSFTCCVSAIADALTSPDRDLHDFLEVFIRDELMTWQSVIRKPMSGNNSRIRELVNQNVRMILNRAQVLSCKTEREQTGDKVEPMYQTILDLISQATNPLKLAQMDINYLPQL